MELLYDKASTREGYLQKQTEKSPVESLHAHFSCADLNSRESRWNSAYSSPARSMRKYSCKQQRYRSKSNSIMEVLHSSSSNIKLYTILNRGELHHFVFGFDITLSHRKSSARIERGNITVLDRKSVVILTNGSELNSKVGNGAIEISKVSPTTAAPFKWNFQR